jgi:hypothetical protein
VRQKHQALERRLPLAYVSPDSVSWGSIAPIERMQRNVLSLAVYICKEDSVERERKGIESGDLP